MSYHEFADYAYYVITLGFVIFLYLYIVYVHTDKKRGEDYEKFGRLALDDELGDKIIDNFENKQDEKNPGENKKGDA